MRRTFAAAVLLAALVLSLPGKAVAGPPEGVSGKMTFDTVANGLRKYRKETDLVKGLELLRRLAATRDPRVTLAVGEQLCVDSPLEKGVASEIILGNHFPPGPYSRSERYDLARAWWEENKAELRRRAAQLPR